jgi:CP family cyanate transporter-like MFS transporter
MVAALAIPGGLIADRIGPKKAAGIGAILIAAGTALRGTAVDADALLAFTYIYGTGMGLCVPNIPKIVSAWAPAGKAAGTAGLFHLGMPLGAALIMNLTMSVVFPVMGTYQGVFLVWSIPPIAAAVFWWTLVKEPPGYIVTKHTIHDINQSFRSLVRNRYLWMISLFLFLSEFANHSWFAWAPTLLQIKGATPEAAGMITSIILWVAVPSIIFMPRLCDRIGLRKPFLWIPSLALGLVALSAIYTSVPLSIVLMIIVGICIETRYIATLVFPVDIIPEKDLGTASGLLFIGYIGGVIGPYIGGRILDYSGSFKVALLVLFGISLGAMGLAISLPETGPRAKSSPKTGSYNKQE